MTLESLRDYIAENSLEFIEARDSTDVPLAAIDANQIFLREFQNPVHSVAVLLDPGDVTTEWVTMQEPTYFVPVDVYVFAQRDTEAVSRQRARALALALRDCLRQHPDFMTTEGLDEYDGVEAKADTKACKIRVIFETAGESDEPGLYPSEDLLPGEYLYPRG